MSDVSDVTRRRWVTWQMTSRRRRRRRR